MARILAWSLLAILLTIMAGCSREPEIDGRSIGDWIGLFRHEDWQTRARAQEILSRLGEPALPYLLRSLRSPDPAIRRGAVITMRRMGQKAKGAVETLLSSLSREEVDAIRAEILYALLSIDGGRKEVQETFRKRLQDRSEQVRAAAQAGLDFLRPPAPVPLTPESKPAPADLKLRQALAEKLPGIEFALLAEVERDNLRAAIFWPAFRETKVLDDDVSGQVFRLEGESWSAQGEPFKLSVANGAELLSRALAGADKQQVIRECGVGAEKLAEHLATFAAAFDSARQAGKAREAVQAAETLARAFDYRTVAFSDRLEEMLLKGTLLPPTWQIQVDAGGNTARATRVREGNQEELALSLAPCGEGVTITSFQPAGEKERPGGSE